MKTLTQTLTIAALSMFSLLSSAQNGSQYIRLTITSNSNMPSQTPPSMLLQFDASGSDLLASPDQGSAASLGNFNLEIYPFTLTSDSAVLTSIDARPTLSSYRTIPFGIASKDSGYMKIVAEVGSTDPNSPAPAFVWLEQISTGKYYSILDTVKFKFQPNPDFRSDFILHVGTICYSQPTDETCYGYNNGQIYVMSPNTTNFTYKLTQGVNIIYSGVVAGIDTTISNLAAGSYVGVIRVNGIPVDSSNILISSPAPLIADFFTDYNLVNQGSTVNFTDNSSGALTYLWNFGDGDSTTTVGSQSHIFLHPGSFTVTLTLSNNNGCQASTFDIVAVDSVFAPIANNHLNSHPNINTSFNSGSGNSSNSVPVTVDFNGSRTQTFFANNRIVVITDPAAVIRVTITSVNGAVIASGTQTDSRTEYSVPANGIYIVTSEYTDGTTKAETVLAQ